MPNGHDQAISKLLEENGLACCTLELNPDGMAFEGDLPEDYDQLRCGKIKPKSDMNMWMAGSDYSMGGPHRWCCREHGVGFPEAEALARYWG
jgi:hypothetical protein